MTVRLQFSDGPDTDLSNAYALTLTSTPEGKHEFYTNLGKVIKNSYEHLVVLGDFNGRLGADHEFWPACLGHFAVGKINKNEQHLLDLSFYHGLCVTIYYFRAKQSHLNPPVGNNY